jgi:hypothetical protein
LGTSATICISRRSNRFCIRKINGWR